MKSWLTGKDPDAGKDWRREEKGTTEDEMAGWHPRLNGPEFEQSPEDAQTSGIGQSMGLQIVRQNWVAEQQKAIGKRLKVQNSYL